MLQAYGKEDPIELQSLEPQEGYSVAKRVMDLSVCLLALPLLLPVMGIILVLIRWDSRGRAVLVQERIGKGGRPFGMYKFRTMHAGQDDATQREYMRAFVRGQIDGNKSPAAAHKPLSDAQLTRMGSFLRRSSLDELPQFLNVIRGEMSLVGPRPNVPWEVEEYQPWHRQRLEVLPGMTGLAQVRGRSSISFDEIVAHDVEYIQRRSLCLDLLILLRTIPAVLRSKGVG
jgi:lipopolysaccharide/colanic/teichoic acid biosynthesis glycosyltransferase